MSRTEQETRNLFDTWAAQYDADLENPVGILTGYADSLSEAATLLLLQSGASVLDIGIGTGTFAAMVAEQGATITGIDVSEQMLAQCKEKHPDYTLLPGDFLTIPQMDKAFDAVISSFAFHEVPPEQRPAAAIEMARVLKPGGYLLLLDIMFVSVPARDRTRVQLASTWDPDEVYTILADMDAYLDGAGFRGQYYRQTTPLHWSVIAQKPV